VPGSELLALSLPTERMSEPVTRRDCFGHSMDASADDPKGDDETRVRRVVEHFADGLSRTIRGS